jgi:hypothetical protein
MVNSETGKLPTTEQVEWIMAEWNNYTLEEFSTKLGLEKTVVEETVKYLRRLKRVSKGNDIPAVACFREDNLKSIVRCAGAKHGYIME